MAWITRDTGESILVNFSTDINVTNTITPLTSERNHLRDFQYESLLAVDPQAKCAYFKATSMTTNKNPYNSYEENEFESHLVAVDIESGKGMDRFTIKGLCHISISPNGKKLIYIANNSLHIGS